MQTTKPAPNQPKQAGFRLSMRPDEMYLLEALSDRHTRTMTGEIRALIKEAAEKEGIAPPHNLAS